MVAEHITNLPCDKHSGKRVHTQMLVVHSIESPLVRGYAVSMAQNWLGRWYDGNGVLIEASSNVIVGPDTLVRAVHTDYAAWHASWANSLSIGYEQAGYAAFTREQWLTDLGKTQIDRLAREMAMDAKQYGIPLVWLTRAQVLAIAAGNRTIKGLVTHAVIDPANRTDPGDAYPYDVLLASIRKYSGGAAGQSGTITPIPKEEFTMSEALKILTELANIKAVLIEGYAYKGEQHPPIADAVFQTRDISRNKKVPLIQEVADTKSIVIKLQAALAAQGAVIAQLASSQGVAIDYAKIDATVKQAIADAVVQVDVTVGGGK